MACGRWARDWSVGMSERLADDLWRQELEWLKRQPHAAIHQPNAIAIVEELLELRARVAQLETLLREYVSGESYYELEARARAALSETVEA
jgi:broad specificity phosphatase PhoE